MSAEDAAKIFHDWAAANGLMPDGPVSPPMSTPQQLALVQPETDAGRQLLRAKQIGSIAFNEANAEILVFTKRVVPQSKKARAQLPQQVGSFKIVYHQGVPSHIGVLPSTSYAGPVYAVRNVGGSDFYTCGSSISVGNCRDAGTLGCLVRDASGALYGISNNHVSGGCNFAQVTLPIVAPGIFDVVPGSIAPFTVGYHHSSLTFSPGSADNVDPKANRDAAMFKISNKARVSSYQGTNHDTPTIVSPIVPGMAVEKVGRTTQHTTGSVLGQWIGPHPVTYAADLYGFRGTVSFEPAFVIAGSAGPFSDNGDSGSLITTIDQSGQRSAVGIVVGGMADSSVPGGKVTIALPIGPILTEFGVTLVSGHNV
jgi:hypothetical protein